MLGTCGTGVALATVNSSITGASAVLEATMSSAGHLSLLSTDVSTCLDLVRRCRNVSTPAAATGARDVVLADPSHSTGAALSLRPS